MVFFENVFPPLFEDFLAKIRKKIKIGKVRKTDEERYYFEEKKRFHSSKKHLLQGWRVQNIPEVAECLASLILQMQHLFDDKNSEGENVSFGAFNLHFMKI